MKFYLPAENSPELFKQLLSFPIPAGFPSPAADYVETRIDLNKLLIQNPSSTFYAYAEGDSMFPAIHPGSLLIVDRKDDPGNGSTVLASVNNEFCVKDFFKFPDGSVELRPVNPKYHSIFLPSEFEGDFELFGCVIYSINSHTKNGSNSSNRLQ